MGSALIYPVNIRTNPRGAKSPAHYLQLTVYTFVDGKNFVKKKNRALRSLHPLFHNIFVYTIDG